MKETMKKVEESENYNLLIASVGILLEKARKEVYSQVNETLVKTYWEIGKQVVDFEQQGKEKVEYGSNLLNILSKDLKLKYGKGFSKSNVYLMRVFYLKYPKFQTLSGKLSWSHYVELLNILDDIERSFYEKQSVEEGWSVRELIRQKNSALFQRLALSKDKKGVLELAEKGQVLKRVEDVILLPQLLLQKILVPNIFVEFFLKELTEESRWVRC